MALDIQAKIAELAGKIGGDTKLLENFKKDPLVCVRQLLSGIDLPQDALVTITKGIEAKLGLEKGSLLDKIKALFGKK